MTCKNIFNISEATATTMDARRILNRKIASNMDLYKLEQFGAPVECIRIIMDNLRLNGKDMAKTLGMGNSTFLRKMKGRKRLSSQTSGRLIRVARIFALAEHVLGGIGPAAKWLKRSQFGLFDEIPLEIIKTEAGAREVEKLLRQIEDGVLP